MWHTVTGVCSAVGSDVSGPTLIPRPCSQGSQCADATGQGDESSRVLSLCGADYAAWLGEISSPSPVPPFSSSSSSSSSLNV